MARKTTKKVTRNTNTKKIQLRRFKKLNVARTIVLGLLFVPLAFIIYFAVANINTDKPLGSTNTCGATVTRTKEFKQQYDRSMPWNVPVCASGMQTHPQSDDYRDRLWKYGIAPIANNAGEAARTEANRGQFATTFGLEPSHDYSSPIYRASDKENGATTTIKVQVCSQPFCNISNLDSDKYEVQITNGKGYLPDTSIPWNPNWKPSAARDKEMIILDDRTTPAREITLWGVHLEPLAAISNCGILFRDRLCTWGTTLIRDSKGDVADFNGSKALYGRRGMGIQSSPMVITPEEVETGEIRQALYMEAFNTMVGPACTTDQLKTNNTAVVGKTCGFAAAPATKFEFAKATNISRDNPGQSAGCVDSLSRKDYYSGKLFPEAIGIGQMIPSGMRFAITNTNAEIDAWLATKTGYSAEKKKTAKTIAIALRDYGWFVGDTSCFDASFVFSGAANPVTKEKWQKLGISDGSSQELLDGLFQRTKIRTIAAAENQCTDGTKSNYACQAVTSSYPSLGSDSSSTSTTGNVSPTPSPTPTNPVPASNPPTTPPSTPTETTQVSGQNPVIKAEPTVKIALQLGWNGYYVKVDIAPPAGATRPVAYNIIRNNTNIGKTTTSTFNDTKAVKDIAYTYKAEALDANGKVTSTSTNNPKLTVSCFLFICSQK